jgi:hypothetical protein
MKSPEEESKARRTLSVCKSTRIVTGVLAIASILFMVGCAFVALKGEKDTWSAMRLPMGFAILLLAVFVRSTKKILECEAILRE